ncbi:MAG: DUF3572 family protein [Sphingomonadales bacterium]|nr:MAG: DUF3572 family protein [Sphingomonadales bacterium]
MASVETNPQALALQALVWTLGDPALLAATLGFLESYEPDLLACADALGVKPAALVSARAQLETA